MENLLETLPDGILLLENKQIKLSNQVLKKTLQIEISQVGIDCSSQNINYNDSSDENVFKECKNQIFEKLKMVKNEREEN